MSFRPSLCSSPLTTLFLVCKTYLCSILLPFLRRCKCSRVNRDSRWSRNGGWKSDGGRNLSGIGCRWRLRRGAWGHRQVFIGKWVRCLPLVGDSIHAPSDQHARSWFVPEDPTRLIAQIHLDYLVVRLHYLHHWPLPTPQTQATHHAPA